MLVLVNGPEPMWTNSGICIN